MKIQEICKKTGYSKRTIYFYINEGLLSPAVEKPNGHYNFLENDMERLHLIRYLRNAGLSICMIRSILNKPETISHFLNQRIKAIQKEQQYLHQLSDCLDLVMKKLPINPEFEHIYTLCKKAHIPCRIDEQSSGKCSNYDYEQLNRFLWGVFLPETPLNEYQEFLWGKLNKITADPDNLDGYNIICFFNTLAPDHIERFFAKQTSHIKYVSEINHCEEYADEMKWKIRKFIENPKDVMDWKRYYELLIRPQVRIYNGELADIALKMSPLFVKYCDNIHTSCELVYKWLKSKEGTMLYDTIQKELEGYIHLESCHYGELEVMANLRHTILRELW